MKPSDLGRVASKDKVIISVTNDVRYDQRMQKVANSLASAGYQVLVVGRDLGRRPDHQSSDYRVHLIPCWFRKGPLFYLEYNIRLCFFCRRKYYKWHYSVDLDSLLAGTCLKLWSNRIKLIFDAHEYFDKTPELVGRPIKQWIWRTLANWGIPKADHCVTVNQSLARIFSELYQQEFEVVRNVPYSSERSENNIAFSGTYRRIIYQGALNKGRGLECAIATMRELPDLFHLDLIGFGDIEEELKQLVEHHQLEEKVSFHGAIDPVALKEKTSSAWLGLNLLDQVSESYYYSLANKFFDYMQAGIPSVNMNFPEYRQLIDTYHCALTIDQLDPNELARQIIGLHNNQDLYHSLCVAADRASEVLVWEREEQYLLRIFNENELDER